MTPSKTRSQRGYSTVALPVVLAIAAAAYLPMLVLADGKIVAPADYQGSLEERAQEAILIFQPSQTAGEAREDLILKIRVEGEAENFAWIVPFPNEPTAKKEDPKLFEELFNYVEARRVSRYTKPKNAGAGSDTESAQNAPNVDVLSRKIVGSYDVAMVRENVAGALNEWLAEEGYQTLVANGADEVLAFYREKKYVFACMKVSDVQLQKDAPVDLHPLRFSFKTGGRDGMFFPMRMTGLQEKPFDVNLHVFYGKWVNDKLSKFGYTHRGFQLRYRDWDTSQCEPNAGKKYSSPEDDVFLAGYASRIPTVTKLFQRLHPGQQYYLTNIYARGLKPEEVREWSDDLWLFPYYTDSNFVPYDARPDGPASAAWPNAYPQGTGDSASAALGPGARATAAKTSGVADRSWILPGVGVGIGALVCLMVCVGLCCRRGRFGGCFGEKPTSGSSFGDQRTGEGQ